MSVACAPMPWTVRPQTLITRRAFPDTRETDGTLDIESLESCERGRDRFLERLSSRALEAESLARNVPQPCASVGANLSYLLIRLDDLQQLMTRTQNPMVLEEMKNITADIKTVATESMQVINSVVVQSRKALSTDSQKPVANGQVKTTTDATKIVRQIITLIEQTSPLVQIQQPTASVSLPLPGSLSGLLIMELLSTVIGDGGCSSKQLTNLRFNVLAEKPEDPSRCGNIILQVKRVLPEALPPHAWVYKQIERIERLAREVDHEVVVRVDHEQRTVSMFFPAQK